MGFLSPLQLLVRELGYPLENPSPSPSRPPPPAAALRVWEARGVRIAGNAIWPVMHC